MEFLIGIIGYFAIIFVIGLIIAGLQSAGSAAKRGLSNATGGKVGGGLQFCARIDTVKGIKALFLEIKGTINTIVNGYPVVYKIEVNDITDEGEKNFILCAFEEYQASDAPVLHIVGQKEIPYADSILNDWVPLAIIPLEALTFPKKGSRKVEFKLTWIDNNKPIRRQNLTINVKEFGYLEKRENRKKFDKLAAQLAFAVSCSDGELHKDEAHMIRNWVQERVNLTDDEDFKAEVNSLIKKEISNFEKNPAEYKPDIENKANLIKSISSVAERYEVIELLMKITSIDGVADSSEMKIIDQIIKILEVDENKMRDMRDQHIPANIISSGAKEDVDTILGIKDSMSKAEIKKHLTAQYRKWNSLANHPDKEKREQAEYMLKLIGERRSKLNTVV